MTAMLLLTQRASGRQTRGNRILVAWPADVVEQRDGHCWIRTAGGVDLYVTETLEQILAAAPAPLEEARGSG